MKSKSFSCDISNGKIYDNGQETIELSTSYVFVVW